MQKSEVFNLLQFKEVEIIGSANIKELKYPSDIDLQEKITTEKSYEDIYKFFLNLFDKAYQNKNIVITDFKIGFYKGKPLKWTYDDVKNGYVMKDNMKITFEYALNQKSIIKLDVVAFVKRLITEISINYYFYFPSKNHENYPAKSKQEILDQLIYYYHQLQAQGKIYKSLKRLYSYYRLTGDKKEMTQLEKIFNSPLGNIYKQKGALETIVLYIENKFRKPQKGLIEYNLQQIKNNLPKEYHKEMAHIIHSTPHFMVKRINKLIDKIDDDINQDVLEHKDEYKDLFYYLNK